MISWWVEFENNLGDASIIGYGQDTLSFNVIVKVYDNSVKGLNPRSAIISKLLIGISKVDITRWAMLCH